MARLQPSDKTYEVESQLDKGAFYICKPLTQAEEQALLKKFTTTKIVRGVTTTETDSVGFAQAKWDKTVVDWKGITEGEGKGAKKVECNSANKARLMNQDPELCFDVIRELEAKVAEASRNTVGNSTAGSTGEPETPAT